MGAVASAALHSSISFRMRLLRASGFESGSAGTLAALNWPAIGADVYSKPFCLRELVSVVLWGDAVCENTELRRGGVTENRQAAREWSCENSPPKKKKS